jgi:hypothetical protein
MDQERLVIVTPNMTAKQYAAIHLKVPRSGDEDMDAMIRESRRAEFAKAAMGIFIKEVIDKNGIWPLRGNIDQCTKDAFWVANAMLAEL